MTTESYEVIALRYASRMATRSAVFLNYHLYDEPDGPIQMDYYVWVIRSSERTIVVDTGYSELGGRNRNRGHIIHPVELLKQFGTDPADVDTLVITHAHYDHIGNLEAFPRARVLITEAERDFWRGPTAGRLLLHHSCEDSELATLEQIDRAGRLQAFSGRAEIAPGISAIEVGGHTHGQCILTVPTSDGLVLLASDAAHYYEEIDDDKPFVVAEDLDKMYRGFDLIRSLIRNDNAVLLPGHDPDVMHRHRPLDGPLAEHGIIIGRHPEEAS
ncbi:N-acyl homoserine lactonase family protein [Paenarthrobacter sp. DKR-5]|uniref:N-acyl homoserine lactonase family protein n=1 Tax=Paenarthrobacter sp. DKR-5 TaxID=2835535 RepID=UPI001BDD0354|nr:N-acyl homoserine lactonase family protein [Paenarthrobacter sp. DKR-5]MBT1003937.1 N-acyl homoserine lactonase family protein [Paenarthrobacter sp. DKR-5]